MFSLLIVLFNDIEAAWSMRVRVCLREREKERSLLVYLSACSSRSKLVASTVSFESPGGIPAVRRRPEEQGKWETIDGSLASH